MNKIDGSYRLLFSNPRLVRDLFNGIIDEPWLAALDWPALEPLPSDYISDSLRQRQGDCVWRLHRQDGTKLFILLMLEHQSTNDRIMALRVLTYCALLYESLLTRKQISKGGRLPVTLPVVIYSGVPRWSAPLCVSELIDPPPSELLHYLPQMRYLLIDDGQHIRHGTLPSDNFASLLFRLEHNMGVADVQDLMQTIWDRTAAPEHAELRIAFTAYAKHVLLPRALPDVDIPAVDDLLEIKTMLTEHSRSWTHQWKAEGREEGREEGRLEGASAIVQRLLQRKFGVLSQHVEQRLKQATPAQLETWSLNVLDADNLDDVFTD